MDPVTLVLALLASAASATGISVAVRNVLRALVSPEERAGRPFWKIIRDAFNEPAHAEQTLEERIQQLSQVMASSSRLLTDITKEIDDRAKFAKDKKEEAEDSIRIASLNQDQVALFEKKQRQEGNRGIRYAFILAICGFVLGSAVTLIVTLYVHPAWDSSGKTSPQVTPTSAAPTRSASAAP